MSLAHTLTPAERIALNAAWAVAMIGAFQPAHADSWTGRDKAQHATGGFAIGSLTTALTKSKAAGCLVGAGVGFAKEAYDAQHPDRHDASAKDFIVTAAFSCLGAQFSGLFISPNRITFNKAF